MWIVVIIILAVVGKFLYDWNAQQSEMIKRGGMDAVYRELIGYLMWDKRCQIIDRAADAIVIGVPSMVGLSAFMITHSFGKVIVEWKLKHKVYGDHKLEWEFHEKENQEKIAEVVLTGFNRYQSDVLFKLVDTDDDL